jgi:hypothetical protein
MKKFLYIFLLVPFLAQSQNPVPYKGAGVLYFTDSTEMQQYVPLNSTGSELAILRQNSTTTNPHENRIFQYKGPTLKWVELLPGSGANGGTVFRTSNVTPTTANTFPTGVAYKKDDMILYLRNGSVGFRNSGNTAWTKTTSDNGFNVPNSLRVTVPSTPPYWTPNLNQGNRMYIPAAGDVQVAVPDSIIYQSVGEIFVFEITNTTEDTIRVNFSSIAFKNKAQGSIGEPVDSIILSPSESFLIPFEVVNLGEVIALQTLADWNRNWAYNYVNAALDTIGVDTTNIANTWFVNKNGVDATATEGNIFKQAKSPFYTAFYAGVGKSKITYRGTYQAGVMPAFSTTNYKSHGLAAKDSTVFNIDAGTFLTAATNYTNQYPIASDVGGTTFASDSARVFSLLGFPNIKLSTNSTSSPKIPIGFYNANSKVQLQLNSLENLGGGRNWGLQLGCGSVNLDINKIEVSGGISLSVYGPSSTPAVYGVARVFKANIGEAITDGRSDPYGSIRFQPPTPDTSGSYSIYVQKLWNRGAISRNGSFAIAGSMFKTSFFAKFENILSSRAGTKANGYTSGIANSNGEVVVVGEQYIRGSNMTINVGDIITPNVFWAITAADSLTLDSSTLTINITKGLFSSSAPFELTNLVLRNGSRMIINCEDCKCSGGTQSAFWVWGNYMDATSEIVIRGKYRVNGANAVLNTRNNVTLENCTFVNDGTVASIQSDAATSITVKSAYTNSTIIDSDVTETVTPVIRNSNVK